MHGRRLITGLLILPLFLLCVFWSGGVWLSAILVTFFFIFARAELYNLLSVPSYGGVHYWQNGLAVLFFYFTVEHKIPAILVITFLFYWGSGMLTLRDHLKGYRYEMAAHGTALIYILLPLACFVYLRSLENGSSYLYFMLSVACMTDVGAYYGGKLFGRHKLSPVISPNKTIEGTITGTLFACAFIFISAWVHSTWWHQTLWFPTPHHYLPLMAVTLFMSVLGHIGDLNESAMKRDAGVKDSGITVTGHGGFLDMMDSMLWIGPAMLVYVEFIFLPNL